MTDISENDTPVDVESERLDERGDIRESYSADRIAMGRPLRRPFRHAGDLWVSTGIHGSALTASGSCEIEAYRLVSSPIFSGKPMNYYEKTGTGEAARCDPQGFYHGMKANFKSEAYILCGPPRRFIQAKRPDPAAPEPAQLSLF